jgi:urease accessory protein
MLQFPHSEGRGAIVDGATARNAPGTRLERARGEARVAFERAEGRTRISELFQSGSAKLRFPRVEGGLAPEAVLLNTAGGVTGGDRLSFAVSVGEGAHAVATTQAAERIYRRHEGIGEIETTLSVAPGAHLDWLPQETIFFDRSALSRTLVADVAADATLLAAETIVLGRAAHGEIVRDCTLRDAWRIRRDGRLVFADGFRFDGDATAIMSGRATGSGATAFATLVYVAPDAEARLDAARAALDGATAEAGASAWNGLLTARLLAADGQALRAALVRLVESLRGTKMPRVWNC